MARILVVDDDKGVRTAMCVVLEQEGFEVAEAQNGDQALELCRAQPPHLILCDIFMPQKDGFDTIRELQKTAPKIPIVAVSGASDVLQLARKLGAVEVLYKPLSHAGLMGAVRRTIKTA
jgi:CheY-like chemotaxis protein